MENFGGVCWMKSEPILSKIQRILRIESRPAFPPPPFRLRRAGKRAKIHFPHTPFSFCPLAFGLRPIFLRTGYKSKGWRVGLELKSGHRLIFNVLTMIYFLNKTIPLIFCYLLLQNIFHIH